MRNTSIAILILTFFTALSPPVRAEDDRRAERQRVLRFLRREVLGKPLVHHSVSKIDDGKVEVDFTRTMTFANVIVSERGFRFDALVSIKQTNYDLDVSGKRTGQGVSKDRSLVVRYEVGELVSTGKLLGFSHVVTNSLRDSSGYVDFVVVRTEGDTLRIKRSTIGYTDGFAAGGKEKPFAEDTEQVISVSDGLLRHVETSQGFDVDPTSLKRTPDGELDTMVSVERR